MWRRREHLFGGVNIILALTLLVVSFTLTHAQGVTGTISGWVRDERGAVVPEVTVSLRNLDTGFTRQVRTNEEGRYLASGLPLGTYQIEATKPGFRTEVRTGIRLTVGREEVVDFVLRVGPIEERVEVSGGAPLIELTTAALGDLVDERKVRDLPLNGRDVVQLITLQTGVNVFRTDRARPLTGGKGTRLSVAGVRMGGNIYMLDGTIINGMTNRVAGNVTGQLTGVETIKEFRVLTSSYSAEYPRVVGGAFNIVTKSGTNEWHGSVFEFLRNDNLDARNFFDGEKKPEFKRNQFGFSVGGPLRRDRHFVFGSYEGLRETLGLTVTRTVPDVDARRGIVGGRTVEVNPVVRPYLAIWPLPTVDPIPGDGAALYVTTFSQRGREDFFTARTDLTLSSTDTLMIRYTFSDSRELHLTGEVFPEFPNRATNRAQYVTIAETKTFSPWVVNEVRFGFARTTPLEEPAPVNPYRELAFVPGEVFGAITISGFDIFGTDRTLPIRLTQNSFQFYENLSLLMRRHSMKVGFAAERFQWHPRYATRERGEFQFTTLADFLQARPLSFLGVLPGSNLARSYRQSLWGWYVVDEFRISPRFTFNYGLRHEIPTDLMEKHGQLSNVRYLLDPAVTVGKPFQISKKLFNPRLGFAWGLTGDGKTALRGGFGIFVDPFLIYQWWYALIGTPPFSVSGQVSNPPFPNALPALRAVRRPEIDGVPYDHGQPYVYQYNLTLQRELLSETALTLAYVGSRGVHLGRICDANIGSPGNPIRRNPNFGRIQYRLFDTNSIYNSFQLGLNKRFSRGFQLQGSWTWSKSIDEASSQFGPVENGDNGQPRCTDPFDRKRDRGPSDFDVRHNLTLNGTWELPFGKGRRFGGNWSGLAEALLGGWQVSGIATFTSGQPFTPHIRVDLDQDGSGGGGGNWERPNLRPGRSPNPRLGRPEKWFDPSAFFSLTPGTRGNLGRNTLRGAGVVMIDVGVMKNIRISERGMLQFRLEIFNLPNHTNFASPPLANLEIFNQPGPDAKPLPEVGRIRETSTSSRQLQFALRFSF